MDKASDDLCEQFINVFTTGKVENIRQILCLWEFLCLGHVENLAWSDIGEEADSHTGGGGSAVTKNRWQKTDIGQSNLL